MMMLSVIDSMTMSPLTPNFANNLDFFRGDSCFRLSVPWIDSRLSGAPDLH
jgi:hypothetical protein